MASRAFENDEGDAEQNVSNACVVSNEASALPQQHVEGQQLLEKSYTKLSEAADDAGVDFELKMFVLVYLRLVNSGWEFYLGSNVKAAGLFDDIVVKYRANPTQSWNTVLLQLKHKKKSMVAENVMLTLKDDFSLVKYWDSYRDLRFSQDKDLKFLGDVCDNTFIIFTNACIQGTTGIDSYVEDEVEETLDKANIEAVLNTGGKVDCIAQESQVFQKMSEWVDLKDLICTIKGELQDQSNDVIKTIIKKVLDQTTFMNNAVNSTIQALNITPTAKKIEEILQILSKVGDKGSLGEFLTHLQLYTNQARGTDLDDKIKQCLLKTYKCIESSTADSIFLELIRKVKLWRENKSTYLTHESRILQDIICAHIKKISESHINVLTHNNIDFMESSLVIFCDKIPWATGGVFHVVVESRTTASSIKMMQALARFTNEDNILYVNMATLLLREDEIIGLWSSRWCRILVVECDTEPDNEGAARLRNKITKAVEGNTTGKLFVLIGQERNSISKDLKTLKGYTKHEASCNWSQLSKNSQEYFLSNEVNLQGSKSTLEVLINENGNFFDEVNGDVISQLLSGDTLCGKDLAPVIDVFVPRRLKAVDSVPFTVSSVSDVKDKVVLVVAKPGMGTSTLMTHLARSAKAEDPTAWIVHLKLNECMELLATMEVETFNRSAAKTILHNVSVNPLNRLEHTLFRHLEQNMLIIIDGIDEVYPIFEKKILAFLGCLTQIKIKKLWVISRPLMRQKLEHVLSMTALVLEPFSQEEQYIFFLEKWRLTFSGSAVEKLESYSKTLISASANFADSNSIRKVPLLSSMIADVLEDDLRKYLLCDSKTIEIIRDKLSLYETFIRKKLYRDQKYSAEMKHNDEEIRRQLSYRNYQLAALRSLFSTKEIFDLQFQEIPEFERTLKDFLEDVRNGREQRGIIDNVSENGTPHFRHSTFAEYFCAHWLSENFKANNEFTKRITQCPSLTGISDMFSRFLARDCTLHTAVLNDDAETVDRLLKSFDPRNSLDAGGRTPLHLAVLLSGTKHNVDILRLLLQHTVRLDIADSVLGWRPLQYANAVHAYTAAGMILSMGGSEDDMLSIRSIKQPTRRAFKKFIKKSTTASPDSSMMLAAARDAGLPVVRYLVEERRGDVQCRGPRGETMLHMAAEGGDLELLEYLYDLKPPIPDEDSEYVTPLSYAARNGHTDVVRALLQARSGDRCYRQTYQTALDCEQRPARTGLEGLNTLVTEGEERFVGIRDDNGRVSALELAVFRAPLGSPDSMAKIIKQGNEYLYIHDEHRFVGYGRFTGTSHLNKLATSGVTHAKKAAVLREFQIEEVLSDRLSDLRESSFNVWERQINQVVEHPNFHEITEIIRFLRKFNATIDKDMEILNHISKNSRLSQEVKEASRQLYEVERKVKERSEMFGFNPVLFKTVCLSNILLAKCEAAMASHYHILEERFKDAGRLRNPIEKSLFPIMLDPRVLLVRWQDIELFKGLDTAAKTFGVDDLLAGIFQQMWYNFFINALAHKAPRTLTTPVYQYLFISFMETVTELSASTTKKVSGSPDALLQVNADSWDMTTVQWPTVTNIRDQTLKHECQFLIHMMKHAEPGKELTANAINKCQICNTNSVGFRQRMFGTENTADGNASIESLIWTNVLHNNMHFLLKKLGDKCDKYKELLASLENAYATFVSDCDSYESCRVTGRAIIGFAAQMFEHIPRLTQESDAKVLQSMINLMVSMMKHGTQFAKYLPSLIAEFVLYWENRNNFNCAVGVNFMHEDFVKYIENISEDLHGTLIQVIDSSLMTPDLILDFLRLFNEYLNTFQQINFVWLVEKDLGCDFNLVEKFTKEVTGRNTSHLEVTDQKAFVAALLAANVAVPKHHVLEIARRLTTLIFRCLLDEAIPEETRVQGTGNLLSGIHKAFIHLDEQVNYQSLQQFQDDLCTPFESVASKMNQYDEFKRQLDNLENFYVYTRKQDEIDIDKALEMFQVKTGNTGNFVVSELKASFKVYDNAFKANISDHYCDGINILEKIKSEFSVQDHSQWDVSFKRERIPVLLAAVSALWSIRESEHVRSTGQSIKPHCIQILCVLRLLSVDQDVEGLRNHLAEVLTGQGKSLVLGLLASVLALTGHFVQVVCYSKYLASRDQQAFEDFFEALGITDKVKYGTFYDMANEVLRVEVNGTFWNARELFREMLVNELSAAPQKRISSAENKASKILLIDEVDVFFTTEFYGNVYASCVNLGMPALAKIQEKIWSRKPRVSENAAREITREIQEYVKQLVAENSDNVFTDFFTTSETLFQKHLGQMVDDALLARKDSEENNKFKLDEKGIITFREKDGLYTNTLKLRYKNAFQYLRLKGNNFDHKYYQNYGYLNVDCGDVSYAELPKEYPVILGVSGTISTLSHEETNVVRDTYGIKQLSCMPTFFGRVNLAFDHNSDFLITDDEKQWQDAILQSVREKQKKLRAVIVFFDTQTDIDKFANRFKNDLTMVNKLTGNEEASQLERSIKDTGVAGSLTLALCAMGRGVDYRTSLTVEQNGGVHVVQTFLSLDVKEETQIKGRTARKDNKGSYELILCKDQLVAKGFLTTQEVNVDYATLNEKRMTRAAKIYLKNGKRVAKALEHHKLSLEVMKSFETYHPNKRSSYISKYPFEQLQLTRPSLTQSIRNFVWRR